MRTHLFLVSLPLLACSSSGTGAAVRADAAHDVVGPDLGTADASAADTAAPPDLLPQSPEVQASLDTGAPADVAALDGGTADLVPAPLDMSRPEALPPDVGDALPASPVLPACSLTQIYALKRDPAVSSCGTYFDGQATIPCSERCSDMTPARMALTDVPAAGCQAQAQHACSGGISDAGDCLGTLGDHQWQIIGPVACFQSHQDCARACQGASAL